MDHTAVKAPYVRLITVEEGPKGDKISNFDLRLVQPNENAIPTAGLHTIEHMLAGYLRDHMDGVIDCSPFGCRTGFHLIMWGEHDTVEVAKALKASLQDIVNATWEDVQGTDIKSCGNYRDHSQPVFVICAKPQALYRCERPFHRTIDQGIRSA